MPTLATELVRLKPDVIAADVTSTVRAAIQATSTIPIVMTSSADAIGGRLVDNLVRPGGNVTGLTTMLAKMSAKRLQLLKEVTMLKEIAAAAPPLRLKPVVIAMRGRDDFGNVFSEVMKRSRRRGVRQ